VDDTPTVKLRVMAPEGIRLRVSRHHGRYAWAAVFLVALLCVPVPAQESDPAPEADGESTSRKGGLIPIPYFITEPALGNGLAAVLGYLHPRVLEPEDREIEERTGQKRPPNVSGGAVAYVDNGSWGAGGGHFASWAHDRIRYAGIFFYVDLESTYYLFDDGFEFSLKAPIVVQDLKFRMGDSRFFLGGKLSYLDATSEFLSISGEQLPVDLGAIDARDVGLALHADFDRRDNNFTPNKGQLISFDAWRFDESFGGDFDYWKYKLSIRSFHQLHRKLILGLRLDGEAVEGDPPFYAYSYVSMRGIPALRYQDERASAAEVEVRWNIFERWALIAFGGLGATDGDIEAFDSEDRIYAYGGGVRYFLLKQLDLWLGIDVARGPEETNGYITVGQAW
jgi:hypothetical protein